MEQGHKAHGVAEPKGLWHFAKIQGTGPAAGAGKVEAVVKVSCSAHKV